MNGKTLLELQKVLQSYPEVIAAYLFGSCLTGGEQPGDVDLALLLKNPVKGRVSLYMDLYPELAKIFDPLEVDLLFLDNASLPVRFEVISAGRTVYCTDEEVRTDFEYIVSGEYMDFKHHLDAGRRELYEALGEVSKLV